MSALTIVQTAASELNLPVPSIVFSSTDQQVIQLRTLMNRSGLELMEDATWTRLTKEFTFTTVAADTQVNALPSDLGWIIPETMWDRTFDRQVDGPLSAAEWQREKGAPSAASVYFAFRVRGADLLMTPPPPAGNDIYYEYVTSEWAADNGGTPKTAFTADDDTALLNEDLIVLSLKWRFLKAKNLDYSEEFRTYEMQRDKALARDGGKRRLNLSRSLTYRRQLPYVPEGNWPLP